MKQHRRPRILYSVKNKYRLYLVRFFIVMLVCLILFYVANLTLRPTVRQYALASASYIATKAINDAINEELTQSGIDYLDLVTLEKDTQGRVTALHTNIVKINSLKAEIANIVIEKLYSMNTTQIGIPLGNLTGIELFNGKGPRIKVTIVPVGSAATSFQSVFSDAGINQTRHQIIMEVTASISVLVPGDAVSTQVSTQVNVAETVIIGVVPDSYTYIEDTSGDEPLQKYKDYSYDK